MAHATLYAIEFSYRCAYFIRIHEEKNTRGVGICPTAPFPTTVIPVEVGMPHAQDKVLLQLRALRMHSRREEHTRRRATAPFPTTVIPSDTQW